MMFASCTCIVLAAACFSRAALASLELIEETKIFANTSRETEYAREKPADIGEEHRERNYGTITQKRKKVEKAIATGQGTKSTDFSEEIEQTNNPFHVFEDDIYVYDRTIAAADVNDDRPGGVTTLLSVISDHKDLETKGDVAKDLSNKNNYDTTNVVNGNYAPSHDLADQLAYNEYRAQTNFIPQTKYEQYAQLLASYRFMKIAERNDWTDSEDRTHDYTRVTETIDYSTDLDAVKELMNPRRQKILEYIKRQTYLAFRKKVDNMSTMNPAFVPPAPASPAGAVFGPPPLQCPKKKITFKASTLPGVKLNERKPRRGFNDYSDAFDNSGITLEIGVVSGSVLQLATRPACLQHTSCQACATHSSKYSNIKCVWCDKLQKCTSGWYYNQPLRSACHFSETCNQSMDPVTVPTTDYRFTKSGSTP